MAALLQAVAEAPPNAFAGGGYWEAMHGTMAGHYEVRVGAEKLLRSADRGSLPPRALCAAHAPAPP